MLLEKKITLLGSKNSTAILDLTKSENCEKCGKDYGIALSNGVRIKVVKRESGFFERHKYNCN